MVFCFSGGVLSPTAAKKSTPAPAATQRNLDNPSTTSGATAASSLLWWRGGGGEVEAKESWLSAVALKIKQHAPSAGSNRAKVTWTEYESRKSELTRNPDDPRLQLDTAEALLKWIRHTTNGNFPRVSAEGKVCDGDSPASRAIWRKHAPEALRLLKTGATHALDSGSSDGGYDLAKVSKVWGALHSGSGVCSNGGCDLAGVRVSLGHGTRATWPTSRSNAYGCPSSAPISPLAHRQRSCGCIPPFAVLFIKYFKTLTFLPFRPHMKTTSSVSLPASRSLYLPVECQGCAEGRSPGRCRCLQTQREAPHRRPPGVPGGRGAHVLGIVLPRGALARTQPRQGQGTHRNQQLVCSPVCIPCAAKIWEGRVRGYSSPSPFAFVERRCSGHTCIVGSFPHSPWSSHCCLAFACLEFQRRRSLRTHREVALSWEMEHTNTGLSPPFPSASQNA